MPLTTIYGGSPSTRIIGDSTALEESLHPAVMAYVNAMRSPTGGNYSITANEIDAVNNMVKSMVANGIWSKMKAVYPIIGGTAAAHKYNLVDSRDLDAAFRLSFIGGWTHSSTGITSNGTTGYADTFLTPSTSLSLNSTHISCYIRTNILVNEVAIGVYRAVFPTINLFPIFSGLSYFRVSSSGDAGVNTGGSTLGLFIANRISATETRNYRNGIRYVLGTASTSLPSAKITIAKTTDSGGINTNQFAFFSIGDGLTDSEGVAFNNIVQAFQTKLGRQV